MNVPSWDDYFLRLARQASVRSKDPHTKLGCIIVGPNKEPRSLGYNGFPRGINDEVPERYQKPEKYAWTSHAELNAITNAARCGTPLDGCTLYVGLFPCMECAKAIVQAGIKEVVVDQAKDEERALYDSTWHSTHARARQLFAEARVAYRMVKIDG